MTNRSWWKGSAPWWGGLLTVAVVLFFALIDGCSPSKVHGEGGHLGPVVIQSVTVANAGTTSDAANLRDYSLRGVYIPAGMEGTTITFTVAPTLTGTYVPLRDKTGAAYSITLTTAIAQYLPVDSDIFSGIQYIKVVLASQTGAIVLGLHTR